MGTADSKGDGDKGTGRGSGHDVLRLLRFWVVGLVKDFDGWEFRICFEGIAVPADFAVIDLCDLLS